MLRLLRKGSFLNSNENSLSEAVKALSKGDDATSLQVVDCLDYLRQCIGVPRDMSYPAARLLRTELLNISAVIENEITLSQPQ